MNFKNKPVIVQIIGAGIDGGVEAMVFNYCTALSNLFHFIIMIQDESKIINRKTVAQYGIEIVIIPHYSKFVSYKKRLNSFFASRTDIDIVHSNLSTLSFLPLREAKRKGISIRVCEAHSTDSKKELLKTFLKWLCKKKTEKYLTDRFACSKLAGEYQYCSHRRQKSFFLLPNAIDLQKFRYSSSLRKKIREFYGISDKKFVLGHIGRMVKQKNQLFLIDILSALNDDDCILLFLGQGPLKSKIVEYAKKRGVLKKIIFAGTTEFAYEYYNAFDAFILPSLYEGLPVVSVEAQANGLPVALSTEITREAKILESTVYLPIHDSNVWADYIRSLKEKNRIERNVDPLSFSGFDMDVQKNKLAEKYLELVKRESKQYE